MSKKAIALISAISMLVIVIIISKHYVTDLFCYLMSLVFSHFSISVNDYAADVIILIIFVLIALGLIYLYVLFRDAKVYLFMIVAALIAFFAFNFELDNKLNHINFSDNSKIEKASFPRL